MARVTGSDIEETMMEVASYGLQFEDLEIAMVHGFRVEWEGLVGVAKERAVSTLADHLVPLVALYGQPKEFTNELMARLATEWIEGFTTGLALGRKESNNRREKDG